MGHLHYAPLSQIKKPAATFRSHSETRRVRRQWSHRIVMSYPEPRPCWACSRKSSQRIFAIVFSIKATLISRHALGRTKLHPPITMCRRPSELRHWSHRIGLECKDRRSMRGSKNCRPSNNLTPNLHRGSRALSLPDLGSTIGSGQQLICDCRAACC